MPDRLDPTFVRAQIESLRISHPGIWDDGDEQLLLDSLEGETDFHRFIDAILRRMLPTEACADGIDDLIRDIKVRQERFEQRIDALRSLAFKMMNVAAVRKVERPGATLNVRANPPKVIIIDETLLPPDCVRVRTEPNKIAIKERLTRGEPVPGAELSNAEPTLAVRVK